MDLQLKGKRALVTGSTAGIGYAIASLASEGTQVILNGRSQSRVDAALAKLRDKTGNEALGLAADLGTREAADAVVSRFPDLDILVNNMGIFEPKPFEQIPDDDCTAFSRSTC